jgi:hypothetical protein
MQQAPSVFVFWNVFGVSLNFDGEVAEYFPISRHMPTSFMAARLQ